MPLEIPTSVMIRSGALISREIKKSVERYAAELRAAINTAEMERSGAMEALRVNEVWGGITMESFMEQLNSLSPMEVALERNPAKLCHDIAKRLVADEAVFGEDQWNDGDANIRAAKLSEMLTVIGQELELPSEIIRSMRLKVADLPPGTHGTTNIFVKLDESGGIVMDSGTAPTITLNKRLLDAGVPMTEALKTLFHESLHVMQQVSVTEAGDTILNMTQRELWADEIRDILNDIKDLKGQSFEEYITTELEAYAHAYDQYLIKVYNGCKITANWARI